MDDASTVGYAARNAAQEACESTADAANSRVAVAEAMAEIRTDAMNCRWSARSGGVGLVGEGHELAREPLRRAADRARSLEGKAIASAEARAKKAEARAKAEIAEAVAERARLVSAAEEKVRRTEAEAKSRDVAAKKRLKDAEAKLEALAAERNDLTRQIAASSGAMAKAMAAMAERAAGVSGVSKGVSSRARATPGSPSLTSASSAKGVSKGVSPARPRHDPRLQADDASPVPTRGGFDGSFGVALPGMVEAAARLRAANDDQVSLGVGLVASASASASASAAYRLSVSEGPISPGLVRL